jgi:transposase
MDNASFHHTQRIEQMCCDAGVKLVYLPPYLPDFNLIEEFFSELKAFIKRAGIIIRKIHSKASIPF